MFNAAEEQKWGREGGLAAYRREQMLQFPKRGQWTLICRNKNVVVKQNRHAYGARECWSNTFPRP